MLLTIQQGDGTRSDVLLVAIERDRMRLVPRDSQDTIEVVSVADQWFDELGRRIVVEAMIRAEGVDYSCFQEYAAPRVMTAGGN